MLVRAPFRRSLTLTSSPLTCCHGTPRPTRPPGHNSCAARVAHVMRAQMSEMAGQQLSDDPAAQQHGAYGDPGALVAELVRGESRRVVGGANDGLDLELSHALGQWRPRHARRQTLMGCPPAAVAA